jgi:hypothetical protein
MLGGCAEPRDVPRPQEEREGPERRHGEAAYPHVRATMDTCRRLVAPGRRRVPLPLHALSGVALRY